MFEVTTQLLQLHIFREGSNSKLAKFAPNLSAAIDKDTGVVYSNCKSIRSNHAMRIVDKIQNGRQLGSSHAQKKANQQHVGRD